MVGEAASDNNRSGPPAPGSGPDDQGCITRRRLSYGVAGIRTPGPGRGYALVDPKHADGGRVEGECSDAGLGEAGFLECRLDLLGRPLGGPLRRSRTAWLRGDRDPTPRFQPRPEILEPLRRLGQNPIELTARILSKGSPRVGRSSTEPAQSLTRPEWTAEAFRFLAWRTMTAE